MRLRTHPYDYPYHALSKETVCSAPLTEAYEPLPSLLILHIVARIASFALHIDGVTPYRGLNHGAERWAPRAP
jgi:hypothetical protein